MIEIVNPQGPWAHLHRPIRTTPAWPGTLDTAELRLRAAALSVIDVLPELIKKSESRALNELFAEVLFAAREVKNYNDAELAELRSQLWRSAHAFIVANVDVVDRGRELSELADILKIRD